jgi:hypothetical protein
MADKVYWRYEKHNTLRLLSNHHDEKIRLLPRGEAERCHIFLPDPVSRQEEQEYQQWLKDNDSSLS